MLIYIGKKNVILADVIKGNDLATEYYPGLPGVHQVIA